MGQFSKSKTKMITVSIIFLFLVSGLLLDNYSVEGSEDLPAQCSNYLILDDASRNIQNEYPPFYADNSDFASSTSPDWYDEDWYRLMGDAGTYIPESNPGEFHCGTGGPGYLTTSHPTEVGETKAGQVCFDASEFWNDDCYNPRQIQITNCQDFFVYKLKPIECCYPMRYCGTFNL